MNKIFKALVVSIACVIPTNLFADTDITLRLASKLRGDLGEQWAITNYTSSAKSSKIKKFLAHPRLVDYEASYNRKIRPFIQDDRVYQAAVYLTFKKNYSDLAKLLDAFYFDKMLALREMSESPRLFQKSVTVGGKKSTSRAEAHEILNLIDAKAGASGYLRTLHGTGQSTLSQKLASCVSSLKPHVESALAIDLLKRCIVNNSVTLPAHYSKVATDLSFASLDLRTIDNTSSGSVISRTGYTRGNSVGLLNLNRTAFDARIEKIYAASFEKIVNPYIARWKGKSNQQMIAEMRQKINAAEKQNKNPLHETFEITDEVVYSDREGKVTKRDLFTGSKHPQLQFYGDAAQHAQQTFPNILEAVRSATSMIFLNVYYFGGTTAAGYIDEVLTQLRKKPKLIAVFMHDELNGAALQWEMKPLFNFVRAYMAEHPDRLIAVPSNVYQKVVSGVPSIIAKSVNNPYFEKVGLSEQLQMLTGVSDHSKVTVIDADDLSKTATAIVGSKNWTDSSGSLSEDESVRVMGPHAQVTLDNYYYDFYNGILFDWQRPEMKALWDEVYEKGWAQSEKCKSTPTTMRDKIESILCPFDLLQRYKNKTRTVEQVDDLFEKKGFPVVDVKTGSANVAIRTGENNWNGSIRTALNQDLEAIYLARKQIVISEQLLIQPLIVKALLEAQKRKVQVYAVIEPFASVKQSPGMPNSLYIADMIKSGMKIRFKSHGESSWCHGEFHGKTLSVDGWTDKNQPAHTIEAPPILIIGSANKDFMTLTGAFREHQLEVSDPAASQQHDRNFWYYYNSNKESFAASIDLFKNSPAGKAISQRGVEVENFLEYARWMISSLYRFKSVQ